MTSSPISKFDAADPRVLLVAAERATLYRARRGRIVDALQFMAGDEGLAAFARYLAAAPTAPVSILVDVVEEEYRQDTIPHVFGRDRRAVLGRRFARQFRGSPYWLALAQGREPGGRRDERVLLAALTRPELVSPWVAELLAHRVPLVGIHSLPVLGGKLLKRIGAKGQNILLISVQQVSGLRQTFFRDGHLKISRLAAMPRFGTVPYASFVGSELDKLRRYLNSLALTSRDAPLEVYMLSHGDLLAELRQECRDSDTERFRLVDIADLARILRIAGDVRTPYADLVFAQLLLDDPPRVQYAQPAERRFYTLRRARIGLFIAGVTLLLASTAYSTLRFVEALDLKQQALDAAQKANFYWERFELARRGLPPTPVEPSEIEQAVAIVATLEARRSTPLPWLAAVGAELNAAPEIRLEEVQWTASSDPNAVPAATQRETPVKDPIAPSADYAYYEIGILRGEIAPFSGDWRSAIARVDALAAALRAHPRAVRVEVLSYPLDLESTAKVSGDPATAWGETLTARFALKLVLGVANDAPAG